MGNLVNSLVTVAESMRATQLAIEVGGNNIANAKTPGYAKQRLDLLARRFEVDRGLAGGVEAGKLLSGRKVFLEQGVQEQSHRHGRFAEQTSTLERLEPVFDISSNSGINGSLNRLYRSFSALSVSPNDTPAREAVLENSRDLAQNFQFTVASLDTVRTDSRNGLRDTVERINRIGGEIQKYNLEVREDTQKLEDPGLDAQLFRHLEDLAELVDFNVIRSADGSVSVNLGGQTSLAAGGSFYPVSADFSGAAVELRDAQGAVITGQIQQGRLRAQLDLQNTYLPSFSTDLNLLAQTVADSVNAALAGGVDRNGNTPVTDLFRYNTTTGAAGSLTVNNLGSSELAAALPGAPGGNGNALALADQAHAHLIGGFTLGEFSGNMAARVGRSLANSRNDEHTQSLLLTQAKSLRAADSEVSIDEEAANIVAFQRQYEANAQLIRILNSLTETTINLIR